MNRTLYSVVLNTAKKDFNKVAISYFDKHVNYRQLISAIDNLANYMVSFGIKAGDRVTVCLPNTPSSAVALYAINKIGAVVNLTHPRVTPNALRQAVAETQSKLLINYDVHLTTNNDDNYDVPMLVSNSGHFMPWYGKIYFSSCVCRLNHRNYNMLEGHFYGKGDSIEQYYQFGGNEKAVFLPSGGTTGDPKIIMHSCYSFNALIDEVQFFISNPLESYKAMYSVLPIFHGFGLCMNMHMCVTYGIINVMSIKFDPKRMAKAIDKYKVSILTGVPAMYKKLLACPRFLSAKLTSLVECFVGGDDAPLQLVDDFNQLLASKGSNGALLAGYGLTETIAVATVNTLKSHRRGSIGLPMPTTKVAILSEDNQPLKTGEIGQIAICSKLMMLGYFQPHDVFTTIDGEQYLLTGDYGYLDNDGYLFFKQRVKNVVKVNGVIVYPSEVEGVTNSVEGVESSCAIGVSHGERGSAIKLFVEPTTVGDDNLRGEILKALKGQVMVYAMPTSIEFVSKIPTTEIGKVDRKAVEKYNETVASKAN